mmetsp:Transcript_36546/g.37942  ORF Transcript_36546/g.37942 Transcript_36546/m.37942 type:complete len:169 (-) Transcript_36546:50-556(-)
MTLVIAVKAITVLMKTVAKPLTSWLSHYHKIVLKDSTKASDLFMKERFVNLGQSYNFHHTKFNRKILRLKSNDPIKLLPAERALEKGIEFFSEIVMYSIIIGIPLWEMKKASIAKRENSIVEQAIMINIKSEIESISEDQREFNKYIDEELLKNLELIKQKKSSMTRI